MCSDFDTIVRLYKKQLYDLNAFRFINHVYVKADASVSAVLPPANKYALEWDSADKAGTNLKSYSFIVLIYYKNCVTYGITYAMADANATINRYLESPKNFVLTINDFSFRTGTTQTGNLAFEVAGSNKLTYIYVYGYGDGQQIALFRYGCEAGKLIVNDFPYVDNTSVYNQYVANLAVCKCSF